MIFSNEEDISDYEMEDTQKLARAILSQALNDYLILSPPSARKKKYLYENYLDVVDLFWDPTYVLDSFEDEDGQPLTLVELLKLAADRDNVSLESFHKYLHSSLEEFWATKELQMKIPQIVTICSKPFYIVQDDTLELPNAWSVDYEQNIIALNCKHKENNNIFFFAALFEIICYYNDLKISVVARRTLAKEFLTALKANELFSS